MNQKGGVGKTTTTVNLGAALAQLGRRTLIVDLDPQAHATLHLGGGADGADGSVYDLLHDPAAAAPIREVAENLWLLPAETDLAAAETELGQAADRHGLLARSLQALQGRDDGRFDFILLDCPPSLGLLTLNGLAAAGEVVIPMQAHFLALQGVGKLLETVALVTQSVNPGLDVFGIVLCMHDAQTTHTQEVVSDLEAFFEQAREQDTPWKDARVLRPPIRRNIKLAEAPSFGQSIFGYAAGAPGALDYLELARNFVPAEEPARVEQESMALATRAPAGAIARVEPPAKAPDPAPAAAVEPKPDGAPAAEGASADPQPASR